MDVWFAPVLDFKLTKVLNEVSNDMVNDKKDEHKVGLVLVFFVVLPMQGGNVEHNEASQLELVDGFRVVVDLTVVHHVHLVELKHPCVIKIWLCEPAYANPLDEVGGIDRIDKVILHAFDLHDPDVSEVL